jgi:CDP-2,3-bis-(O-geranylgeranyl)-sn-glycerol synthase
LPVGGEKEVVINGILLLVLQSIYFMVPAYFANMAPVVVQKLNILKWAAKPIDKGKTLRDGRLVFGKNKTYRGFIAAVVFGIIGAYVQMLLYGVDFFRKISLNLNYLEHSTVIFLGVLMGLGALFGDLIESFFKRRLGIQSGKSFLPWDQLDFILGAYIFILPIYYPILSWQIVVTTIIASFFLHILVNHISFYLGIRKEKW